MAAATKCAVDGLAKEWDGIVELRDRVRNGGQLLKRLEGNDTMDPSNKLAIANSVVLTPILVRMPESALKVPDIEPLRTEVKEIYLLCNKEVEEVNVDDEAWALRRLAGFVKRKMQKRLVSLATGYQLANLLFEVFLMIRSV